MPWRVKGLYHKNKLTLQRSGGVQIPNTKGELSMRNFLIPILMIFVNVLAGSTTFAKQSAEAIMADEGPPEPPDPKKKRPGEECSSDDQCQKHHSCRKTGNKGICTAPPRPKLPPGAVT